MYFNQKARLRQSAGSFKQLLFAVPLIAVFTFSPVKGNAADRYFDLGSFTAPAGATFEQAVGSGSFLDVYSFEFLSSDATGLIGASVGAFGITNLMVELWSNGSEIAATQMYAGSSTNFSAFSGLQTNSVYELHVSGNASDPYGGAYTGGFGMTAAVSPVPEPEIYAMMGIGLALMGWAGRRRRKQQAALITP